MPAYGFFQRADIAVTGIEDISRADAALGGIKTRRVSRLDSGDLRVLIEPGAGRHCGSGHPQGVIEGVQVTGAHIERAGRIIFAADERAHLLRRDIPDFIIAVLFVEQFNECFGVTIKTLPMIGMNRATAVVARNLVAGNQVLHQGLGIFCNLPGIAGERAIHFLLELILGHPLPRADLTAITATCSPADAVSIQQAD